MNNDNFLIEESDLDLARSICKTIKDNDIRNRAVANALASDIASKYFAEVEVDTESGLHKIAHVLNKIDISDIYVKDSYIDVRLYFENGTLCIPKEHYDRNILPVAYMFIKLDEELSGGLVTGFILPNAVDRSSESNGYYKVSEDDLISYYDIEPLLVQNYTDETPDNFEKLVFDYLDEKLEDENEFYRLLLASKYSRTLLKNAANVKTIFNFVSITDMEQVAPPEATSLDIEQDEIDSLEEFDSGSGVELSLDLSNDSLDTLEEVSSIEETETFDDSEVETFELSNEEPVDASEDFILDSDSEELIELEEDTALLEETSSMEDSLELDVSNDVIENIETIAGEETTITEEFIESEVTPVYELNLNTEDSLLEANPEISEDTFIEEDTHSLDNFDSTTNESDMVVEPENLENDLISDSDNSDSQYSTTVTPSIDTIEQEISNETSLEELQELLENENSVFDEKVEEITEAEADTDYSNEDSTAENSQQLENLFGEDEYAQETLEENFIQPAQKGGSKIVPIIGALVIVAALGYFGYTKFINPESNSAELPESTKVVQPEENQLPVQPQEAMPVETVENIPTQKASDEGNALSIPAIEQSLDASILVSNLSVNWEVPAGYMSNSTAKRYFTKMGKIIQLNLKTELLLLSKPPITNKIMVELEFDKNNKKFTVKNMMTSSGEKTVDDVIMQTVKHALDMNLKTNLSSFGTMPGNPVLIIRL